MFQGARDPYVILVTIYVFAPYFATVVVGDPVRGQAVTAMAAKYGGWAVMLVAPLLGAIVDRTGRRKPALLLVTGLLIPCAAVLWTVTPDGGPLGIGGVVALFAVVTLLYALSDTLHNALLLPAAGPLNAGAASGLALAFGNFVSVFLLAFVLWAFALPGHVPWSWIPAAPLFGIEPASHQQDRIVGPIVAVTMALLSLPLFLRVPDVPATGMRLGAAIRAGAGDLVRLVREARGHANALTYIGARMVFTDGLTGILVFSGVYAAGRMGWGTLELLAYGVLLSCVAVIGGLMAGWLDSRVGPKLALQIELTLVIISQLISLGIGRDELFYQPWDATAHAPLWRGPMFTTVPEVALISAGFLAALSITACYASSRTMLTRVVPPERIGAFFGIYSLAGLATSWLAPMLVQYTTVATHSQRLGLLPISVLLAVGLLLLGLVRGGGRLPAS
ncbi:MFS transporter [Sphingosinicellaceae bacterium]|nr:MFS transporter [Sphingosinicellaceae bacterium]